MDKEYKELLQKLVLTIAELLDKDPLWGSEFRDAEAKAYTQLKRYEFTHPHGDVDIGRPSRLVEARHQGEQLESLKSDKS